MEKELTPLCSKMTRWTFACALAAMLAGCGGGQSGADTSTETPIFRTAVGTGALNAGSIALQREGARLNATELNEIAKTRVLPEPFDGPLLSGAVGTTKATPNKIVEATAETKSLDERKSAASRTAVYRFYNTQTSAHFFTTSTTERDSVQATLAHMAYEGPAFYASGTTVPALSPVHRFFNTQTGVHFYTISETERAHVVATLPQFNYEGIAYYASTLAGTGYTPLYRFFYAARGFHFYTNSSAEKDNIIATLPQYSYEGVGYYVLGSDWQTPAVPHSGSTSSQCYQTGSDSFVACGSADAINLNNQQDGHRTAINPMGYSQVISGYFNAFPIVFPLYYPKTDCVRDNVTGLVWEGKAASGIRAGSNTYTNYGDGRPGDASAYVNTVNSLNLCGFSDWRLPRVEELQDIIDHGVTGPRIRLADFPNTPAGAFWSSDNYVGNPGTKWLVVFNGSGDTAFSPGATANVRLVRGAAWSGTRYLLTTATYLTDGANNAVIDRKTGLTWRRCLEGQFWSGSACIGSATNFSHQEALIRGNNLIGWRLPNIKELASLTDRSRQIPALDPDAFPGQGGGSDTWSSTPVLGVSGSAGYVGFSNGFRGYTSRGNGRVVHFVLDSP